MYVLLSDKHTKQKDKTKRHIAKHVCTFLEGSRLTPSVAVGCPGNLKPSGEVVSSGKLEPSSLYRSCLVTGALVTAALAGVGFGCANNPCSVNGEGTEELAFGLSSPFVIEVVVTKDVWKDV